MSKFKESEKHKGMMSFYCPGCKEVHTIITHKQDYPSPVWEFNGDMDNPTVSPSIKVSFRHPKGYGKGTLERCCDGRLCVHTDRQ